MVDFVPVSGRDSEVLPPALKDLMIAFNPSKVFYVQDPFGPVKLIDLPMIFELVKYMWNSVILSAYVKLREIHEKT